MRMVTRLGAIAVLLAWGVAHAEPPVLVVERIAATVGSIPILESEVRARMAVGGEASPGRAAVIDQLVDQRLVAVEARRLGIRVAASEVEEAITRIKASNGLDDAAFGDALSAQGYDMADYRKEIEAQLVQYRAFNLVMSGRIRVSDAELQSLYATRHETRPLAEVREELHQQLYEAKVATEMTRWLKGLREATYVEIR